MEIKEKKNSMRINLEKMFKKYESLDISEIDNIIILKKGIKSNLLLHFRKQYKKEYNRIHHDRQLAYMNAYSKKKYDADVDGYRAMRSKQINRFYVCKKKGVNKNSESENILCN